MTTRTALVLAFALGLGGCGPGGGDDDDDDDIDARVCNVETDSDCCGAIGHDCFGGACVAGVCQPHALAEPVAAGDLAIAGGSLYFVQPTAGLVERMAIDGTGRVTLASAAVNPVTIAATDGAVVWATAGATARDGSIVRLGAGETVPVPIATGEHAPCDLAIDALGAVWIGHGSGAVPYTPGELRAQPTGEATATIASSLNHACGVAVSGAVVYYTTSGTNVLDPLDGTVAQVARGGGTPLTLASNRRGPRYLAVSGTHVYWTDEGTQAAGYLDGRVMRMSRSGGAPEVLSDETHPRGIVVDAEHVYWLVEGQVRRLSLADRTKTTIATLPGRTLTVLVDDADALYFLAGPAAAGGGGQVVKLAK